MTAPKPNAELAYRVLDHIDAHPEQWGQGIWIFRDPECGTAACFAGWACLLSGDEPVEDEDGDIYEEVWVDRNIELVPDRAVRLLGLPWNRSLGYGHLLFAPENTREDLGRLVVEIIGPRPEPQRCENCAPGYDCERGIYTPGGAA